MTNYEYIITQHPKNFRSLDYINTNEALLYTLLYRKNRHTKPETQVEVHLENQGKNYEYFGCVYMPANWEVC